MLARLSKSGVRIVTATFHLDTARWRTVREDAPAKVRLVEVC